MVKINENEKGEIQAWISMFKSSDPEAWSLAESLIWTSSFYKRNKEDLDSAMYFYDSEDNNIMFTDAIGYPEFYRVELIEMLQEFLNQKHSFGYLAIVNPIEIEYEF